MKIGSIVECIISPKNSGYGNEIHPEVGLIYTIRSIQKEAGIILTLEEIINPKRQYKEGFGEFMFGIKMFKELLPPEEQINIKELVKDCQLECV